MLLQFLFPKLSDFVNSDDCIGKITTNSIKLQPLFIQKRFKVNKKHIFSGEKKEKFR